MRKSYTVCKRCKGLISYGETCYKRRNRTRAHYYHEACFIYTFGNELNYYTHFYDKTELQPRGNKPFKVDATGQVYTYKELKNLFWQECRDCNIHFTQGQIQQGTPNLEFEGWLEIWDEAQTKEDTQ